MRHYSSGQIETLAKQTVGQHLNQLWFDEREGRLNSSAVYQIHTLKRMIQDYEFQHPGQPYLLDYYRQINNKRTFLYEHSYDDEKIQVQYGHLHEIDAIRDYESL